MQDIWVIKVWTITDNGFKKRSFAVLQNSVFHRVRLAEHVSNLKWLFMLLGMHA